MQHQDPGGKDNVPFSCGLPADIIMSSNSGVDIGRGGRAQFNTPSSGTATDRTVNASCCTVIDHVHEVPASRFIGDFSFLFLLGVHILDPAFFAERVVASQHEGAAPRIMGDRAA